MNLRINYIKISNLDEQGQEKDTNYALHIFDDHKEIIIGHTDSFKELIEIYNEESDSLLDLIDDYLEDNEESDFDVYFNSKYIASNTLPFLKK